MRIGATIFNQNYRDWDRYEAEEQGKAVPKHAVRSDREIFNEDQRFLVCLGYAVENCQGLRKPCRVARIGIKVRRSVARIEWMQ